MIVGDKPNYGGISSFLTPEVALQFLSVITALIAARQPGNGSPSSEPKIMVETPDGIVEMSSLEYQRYLVEKGLAGQAAPELTPDDDLRVLPGIQCNAESDPQSERPAGAEETYAPISLCLSEWATWVGKDPAEFVRNIVSEAAEGNAEAQAALTFIQHCSLQQVVALLEANKGSSNDPAVESAITTLLAHQVWLRAVIELVQKQNGAPGEV